MPPPDLSDMQLQSVLSHSWVAHASAGQPAGSSSSDGGLSPGVLHTSYSGAQAGGVATTWAYNSCDRSQKSETTRGPIL